MMPRESKASQERLCLYRCCGNSFIIIISYRLTLSLILIINVIIIDVANAWMISSSFFIYIQVSEVCFAL